MTEREFVRRLSEFVQLMRAEPELRPLWRGIWLAVGVLALVAAVALVALVIG